MVECLENIGLIDPNISELRIRIAVKQMGLIATDGGVERLLLRSVCLGEMLKRQGIQ